MVRAAKPKVLITEFGAVSDIEYTALKMLTEAEEKLNNQGISLWLEGHNPEPFKIIRNSPLGIKPGREHLFFNLEKAVESHENAQIQQL